MPYVNVPVPEEHVQDVMHFVLRQIARSAIEPWDLDSVTQLFTEVDEPSRALLSVMARAAQSGRELTEREAGDMIELSQRETAGIMRELQEHTQELNRPPIIIPRRVPEALPNGRTRERRVLGMAEDVAALVQEVERAELAGELPEVDRS